MLRNISELQTQTPDGEPTASYTHTHTRHSWHQLKVHYHHHCGIVNVANSPSLTQILRVSAVDLRALGVARQSLGHIKLQQ